MLYVVNNKGAVIPIRCGFGTPAVTADTPSASKPPTSLNYGLYDFYYHSTVQDATHTTDAAYWMNFLSKYSSSYRGGTADVSKGQAALARDAVFNCPAWGGAQSMTQEHDGFLGAGDGLLDELPGLAHADTPGAWDNCGRGLSQKRVAERGVRRVRHRVHLRLDPGDVVQAHSNHPTGAARVPGGCRRIAP